MEWHSTWGKRNDYLVNPPECINYSFNILIKTLGSYSSFLTMTALGWPHLQLQHVPKKQSEMKENCCEDYNLSLPFSTYQQICTKWNFYTITDTKNKANKKFRKGFAPGASVLSQQVHSIPIWLHYSPRHSHSSHTEGGNFKVCYGNICPLDKKKLYFCVFSTDLIPVKIPKQAWSPPHISEHCSVMKISYMQYFIDCLTPIIQCD